MIKKASSSFFFFLRLRLRTWSQEGRKRKGGKGGLEISSSSSPLETGWKEFVSIIHSLPTAAGLLSTSPLFCPLEWRRRRGLRPSLDRPPFSQTLHNPPPPAGRRLFYILRKKRNRKDSSYPLLFFLSLSGVLQSAFFCFHPLGLEIPLFKRFFPFLPSSFLTVIARYKKAKRKEEKNKRMGANS